MARYLKFLDIKFQKKKNLDEILNQTHKKLFLLTMSFINLIFDNKLNIKNLIKNNNEKWSKEIKSKSDLDNFYIINKNISKINLQKKLRSTVTKKFKPYMLIHNKKFYFCNND